MEAALIRQVNIDEEMQQAYLDYAMSVIVSRALPDARDGLKPVHRRILYAMHDMGLRANTSYKKSARVVGEVLGKYHPHSDAAVYDAMARMAQSFSMRVPLVDGQGNFGSVDGDPPAAMRYTEARLAEAAEEILADLQKETVDFTENFDASLSEPDVLPSAIPNMLVNGATGIAVGMSTNIPPHNLGEVVDALKHVLANWEKVDNITVDDLMQFIQGPDFPTGGVVLQSTREDGLAAAYGKGRGRIIMQAKAHVEAIGRGRERLLVTELPYQVNKATLIERIAKLVRDGTIDGISDLRDESDRQGMRIVIELSKSADSKKVLQALFKRTQMQNTFGIIMLALVNGEPRLLSLKQALKVYLEHRVEVVRRRSEFELKRAQERSHVLEGLRVALQNLDEVVELIRKSADVDKARSGLVKRYELSDIQANAILDMPLRRLAALERKKIETEYKELQALIKKLEGLLSSPAKIRSVVSDELDAAKETYADRRRTQIVAINKQSAKGTVLTTSEIEKDKTVWVGINKKGLISRSLENKSPRPSGRDAPRWMVQTSTQDTLIAVTDQGKAVAVPVHSLPQTDSLAKGEPLIRVTAVKAKEEVVAVFTLPQLEQRPEAFVVTVAKSGVVKKSLVQELPGPISQSFRLARVKKDDALVSAFLTDGKGEIMMLTAAGQAIRFKEDEVRAMGLTAAGVNGIKLKGKDEVVAAFPVDKQHPVTMILNNGRGKRVKVADFPLQGRYGQGVIAWKLEKGERLVSGANQKDTTRASLHLKRLAAKSLRLDDAPLVGRQANGQIVQELDNDEILSMAVPGQALEKAKKRSTKRKSTKKSKKAAATPKAGKKAGTKKKPKSSTSKKKNSSRTKRTAAKAAKRSASKKSGGKKKG